MRGTEAPTFIENSCVLISSTLLVWSASSRILSSRVFEIYSTAATSKRRLLVYKLRSSGRVKQQLNNYLDYVNNVIVVSCCAAEVSSPTELHGFEIYSTATIAKID